MEFGDNMPVYIDKAIQCLLSTRTDIPLKFNSVSRAEEASKMYKINLQDTKLGKYCIKNGDKKEWANVNNFFTVPITDVVLNAIPLELDKLANIPSSLDLEKKIVIRIAYAILQEGQFCIRNAYKKIMQCPVTVADAMKWYKGLD